MIEKNGLTNLRKWTDSSGPGAIGVDDSANASGGKTTRGAQAATSRRYHHAGKAVGAHHLRVYGDGP